MVSRRLLLGALAGLAAPAIAFAEGDGPAPSVLTKKGRRTRSALKHQTADKAALDKAMANVKPLEAEPAHASAAAGLPPQEVAPDEALGRLKHGNTIFARGGANLMLPTLARVSELSKGQKPFAVVIGCADSRTAPELIFDCNLGELFVVRVAGSTVSREGLGSILYAVEHLGSPLIVVLGHTKCGAVGAAVDVAKKHAHLHGSLFDMALPIIPAVLEADEAHPADLQDASIRQNARNIADRLKTADEVFTSRIAAGRLKVVSAVYSLQSGQVEFMG